MSGTLFKRNSRLANRLLKGQRLVAKYDGILQKKLPALDLNLDVDRLGLDHIDREILIVMIEKFMKTCYIGGYCY